MRLDVCFQLKALRTESAAKYERFSSQLEDLKHKKRVTEDVVEESQRRNEEIKDQLKSSDNYRQISHLEERLSDLIEETKNATTTFDQLQKVKHFPILPSNFNKKLKIRINYHFRNTITMMS